MEKIQPILLNAKELGALLGVGGATIWGYNKSGKIPKPILLGRFMRWRRDEIEEWVAAGCPPREKWDWTDGQGGKNE